MRFTIALVYVLAQLPYCYCQAEKSTPLPPDWKIDYDSELASCFKTIGGLDRVIALRWQGGIPVGWIQIHDGKKPVKIDLSVIETNVTNYAKTIPVDPRFNSGWIIIAVHPVRDDAKFQKVDVAIAIDHTIVVKGIAERLSRTSYWEGQIPLNEKGSTRGGWEEEPGQSKLTSVEYTTWDGREYDFYSIKLQRAK
jgi:hypothetical protein